MQIPIQKLDERATLPTRGSASAAGYDLYALTEEPVTIRPHEAAFIHTGLAVAIPEGYFGAVYARSGLASREGLRPANAVGVIDSDYRGELMVSLRNDSEETRTITPGERIAQLVIEKYEPVEFIPTETLDETARGTGGFGSTGKQ